MVAAIILAVVSMCIVPPDRAYADYIDWETICLLFSLMAVMKGFQRAGLFSFLAGKLLKKANTSLKVCAVLVFLPFVLSMLITNDVALITFVPFGLIVLKRAGLQKLSIHVVVLQTIAANLGSMMTPMGNPQNLYLYNISGMSFGELMLTMLPYGALAAVMLTGSLFLTRSETVTEVGTDEKLGNAFRLGWPAVAFVLAVLSLFNLIPSPILAACMLVFLLIADRDSLKKVDYSLLITFIALFIFIGNIGRIPEVGRVALTGVGICFPVITLITAFTYLFGNGGSPLCAMEMGRGNRDEAEKLMGNTFSMLSFLPFTEFTMGLPLYNRIAFSMAFISDVSICKGRSITL